MIFLACSVTLALPGQSQEIYGYLFAHMTKTDYGHLYYSVSEDGLHWEQINNGDLILQHDQYRGHPDITKGHDGRYYMTGNNSGDQAIPIWVSSDLITWDSHTSFIPDLDNVPGFPDARPYKGAPKIFYEKDTEQYIITWHTPTLKREPDFVADYWCSMRTLYVLSKDLKTFTDPKKLFQYDIGTIDVIIRKEGNNYYAIIKDECEPGYDWPTGKSIRICTSENLTGPWSQPSGKVTPSFREAPTLIPRQDGEGYYLYYEQYPGIQYGMTAIKTLEGPWYDEYIMRYSIPDGARHGCMIPLTEKEYKGILKAFGNTSEEM
jgi:hypothetical protein